MKIKELTRKGRKEEVPVVRGEHPFWSLQREMNRLFEDFWRGFPAPFERFGWLEGGERHYSPRVDVTETETGLAVTVELPGLKEKDIEVALTEDLLTIRGEKKEEKEVKKEGYTHTERYFGRFERSVPLPFDVLTDKVEATFSNGVLTITMPRAEAAAEKVHKVEVKAA